MPRRVKKPKTDRRIKGPQGSPNPRGMIIHGTVSEQRDGPGDRHGIIDYLASRGISVPFVTDNEGISQMVPDGYSGAYHTKGLTDVSGIEQVSTPPWDRHRWLTDYRLTVRNSARLAAWFLVDALDVPVTRKNLKRLVVGHDRDHVFGGTSDHWDPGPAYPWDIFRDDAMEWADQAGFRVVATKEDDRKVRTFRASRKKQAYAWAIKRLKRSWRVVVKRQKFQPDHDFGPQP